MSTKQITIAALPQDLLTTILWFDYSEKGTLSHRLVCKGWKKLFDESILKKAWDYYKRGNIDSSQVSFEVLDLSSLMISIEAQSNPQAQKVDYFFRFKLLKQEIEDSYCSKVPLIPELKLQDLKQIDQEQSLCLFELWTQIQGQLHLNYPPKTTKEIQNFLKDPENRELFGMITSLTLSKHSLKTDTLQNNGLPKLPSEIQYLFNLKQLFIESNSLSKLPGQFKKLQQLFSLYIGNNAFTIFPKEICELKQLSILNIQNNKISSLSKEITNLNLESFEIYGNPITSIAIEILNSEKTVFSKNPNIWEFKKMTKFKPPANIPPHYAENLNPPIERPIQEDPPSLRNRLMKYFNTFLEFLVKVLLPILAGIAFAELPTMLEKHYDRKSAA